MIPTSIYADPLSTGRRLRRLPGHRQAGRREPGRSVPFRLCVGLSLLLVIFAWFDFAEILSKLTSLDLPFVALALGLLALQFAASALRWMYILKRQDTHVSRYEALSIYGLGALANLFLVTSIAGISVRAALLVRAGDGLQAALASVTAERIAAVFGLALCGLAGLVFCFPAVMDYLAAAYVESGPSAPASVLLAMLGTLAAGVVALLRFTPVRAFAKRVFAVFSSPASGVALVLASGGIVLLGFAGMALLANSMRLEVDPLFFLAVMPAVAFVSALPISIGGWGVREGMMVAGLSMFSVPAESAIALSITYGLAGLLVAALLGGTAAFLGVLRHSRTLSCRNG